MHEQQLTTISEQLKQAMGCATLRQLGDDSGFVIRERAITLIQRHR